MPNEKILLLLITLVTAFKTFAQPNVAIIEGIIENNSIDSVRILIQKQFLEPQVSYGSAVSSTGTFKILIPVTESKAALFRAGDKSISLYISPGDSVHCTFKDKSVLETMTFTGNNAWQYNYFVDYYRKFNLQHGMFFKPGYSDVFTMKPSEFKTVVKAKYHQTWSSLRNIPPSII